MDCGVLPVRIKGIDGARNFREAPFLGTALSFESKLAGIKFYEGTTAGFEPEPFHVRRVA
jgi:hypothetical protein